MTKKFDFQQVLSTLKNIVAGAGADYVYPPAKEGRSCWYNQPGCPQCIVGRVLAELVPGFEPTEGQSVTGLAYKLRELGFSNTAILALYMAQKIQDQGHTWGAAFAAAAQVDVVLYQFQDWEDQP